MRLRLWLACCFALCACSGPEESPSGPVRSVVLVTLDTTRQDALGCYGHTPSPTPALDQLAAESTLFEAARTVAPMTLPAHASMLTGLIPPRHSVRDNSLARLPEEALSVAEIARERGLRTGAFLAAPVLDAAFGLAQGFDVYDAPTQAEAQASGRHGGRLADDVTARALAWIGDAPNEPFFLWVHYFDPHESYEPTPPFVEAGREPYHGEVAQMDAGFAALRQGLQAQASETAFVVVADHGEALGEHGEETHSVFVYDSTLLVPFLVFDPGSAVATRVDTPVSVVDVAPTILAALGLPVPPDIDGRSLWRSRKLDTQPVYFESLYGAGYFQWSPLVGVVMAGDKYVHASTPELYDVDADPSETTSLRDAGRRAETLGRLEELLERPRLGASNRAAGGPSADALRALGYVGEGLDLSDSPELSMDDRPSPHARAEILRDVREVLALHSAGRIEETIPLAQAVMNKDPRNHTILSLLGQNLRAVGRADESIAPLEAFVHIGPEWEGTWLELARAYVTVDRVDAALERYDAILKQRRDPKVASEIARVFAHLGRIEEGNAWLAERGFAQRQ